MCGGGDGHKFPQDVLGHLDIVLCNHKGFLDVLLGVALAQEVLDLTADLLAGSWTCSRGNRTGPAFRADATGKRLGRPLGGFRRVRDGCCSTELTVYGKSVEASRRGVGVGQCASS